MVEADILLRLLSSSIFNIFKLVEHLYAVSRACGCTVIPFHRPSWPQSWDVWVACAVEMIPLHHVCGCHDPSIQTASHLHIRQIQSVWAHWYAFNRHHRGSSSSLTPLNWPIVNWFLSIWVACGVETTPLRHVWGWYPPHTTLYIHIRYNQSGWALSMPSQGHMGAPCLYHSTSQVAQIWDFWVAVALLMEWKWYHYIMFKAAIVFKLLSILDIYTVFQHIDIDMLSIGKG